MAEVHGDVRPVVRAVTETVEHKAQLLDAMRDAEMCVLQRVGRDKNPYRSTGDVELEETWDRTWEHLAEFRRLQSAVVCLEEIARRRELRDRGVRR